MSFVSDELANVLKSVYMKEESGKEEDANSSLNLDKKNGDVTKEKRSRKHKHKKHSSKSKSRDKKKHKKRKHKSRSRSRSESRSRSRSRSSRSKSPEEIDHDDFILEKEKTLDGDSKEDKSEKDVNVLKTNESDHDKTVSSLEKPETSEFEAKTLESKQQGSFVQSSDDKLVNLDAHSPAVKKEKGRFESKSQSEEKLSDSKRKKSDSRSRSRSKSPDNKSSGTLKERDSRPHSSERKIKRKSKSSSKESLHRKKSRSRSSSRNKRKSKSRSRSDSKDLFHHKKSKSRSHSRNRSSKRRKSKSRSRSKGRKQKRSVSNSRSRSRSHSKSRSPRRKRSRSRSRRRSPLFKNFRRYSPPRWKRGRGSFRRRSRSISRSRRSRSRRRSYSRRRHSRSRSKSRSKSRLRNVRRSRSRSRGRRSRSRSRSQLQNRRSRSISKGRRRRSRSHSHSRERGKRSMSRDRNRSKSKSRSRSKSKSKEKTQTGEVLPVPNTSTAVVNKMTSITDKPVVTTLSSQQVKVAQRAGGKTIAELTAFCKKLQEEKGGAENGDREDTKTEEEESQPVAHHPFLVKEKPDITIPAVIFPVNMNKPSIPTVDPNKPLQEQFPVSCGSKHREKEVVDDGAGIVAHVDGSATQTQQKNEVFEPPPTEKFDISELVAKRMDAQRRLQSDPNDIEALLILQEIQMKMQNWCQSNVKPGQFTGELVKNLLPKEHLQGGFQAWAKKDMFHNLTPVTGGIGMKLLQKMGWKPGQVIGKRGEGHAEPIALTVKIDRKGLSAGKEKAGKKGTSTMLDLQGKHPVSALAEYCSKRKWQLPDYSLIFDHGPAHHKQFLFKVLVNDMEYQPAVVCGNKKQAKAQAAIFALKGLGLIPEDADMSAL